MQSVGSNPACFKMKALSHCRTVGKKANGKPPNNNHFPIKKLQALPLVSANLRIDYSVQREPSFT